MSIIRLLTQEIVVVRPGVTTDRYGNVTKDWTTATRTTVYGWVDNIESREDLNQRDAAISGWRLFLPTGTDIAAGDRVERAGVTYEVDGPPIARQAPVNGSQGEHIEARLRVVAG